MFPLVYDFTHYKKFLAQALRTQGDTRGQRSKLAQALGCGTAFISQVLHGKANFSLEHSIRISEFLNHGESESHYFMLLVQRERAGSKKLESYFDQQIDAIRTRRQVVSTRVGTVESFSEKDQTVYYSSWVYSAVYVCTSIRQLRSKAEIASSLGLTLSKVTECLEFLEQAGLLQFQDGRWNLTARRIHLGNESALISRHHANWRSRALQSLDDPVPEDLHFSGAWTLAESDIQKIRGILLDAIERTEPILRPSPEESGFGVCIDFFRLTRKGS